MPYKNKKRRQRAVQLWRVLHNTRDRLQVLAEVVHSYTKIRKLVQASRAAKRHRDQLLAILLKSCSWRDMVVLRQIASKLQQRKRRLQPWGNVSKKFDAMYKRLVSSVAIKREPDMHGIDNFVRESFRCRAICVTSSRFGKRGVLPKQPVSMDLLPYRVYGYSKGSTCVAKHRRWCQEYRDWAPLPALAPYKRQLTEAMLKERCSVGPFVRLQILTDLCHRLGAKWVELPVTSLGTGVKFGKGIMGVAEVAELRALLNQRRQFREIWGSAISLHETGHLVCETRQHVWQRMRASRLTNFIGEVLTAGITDTENKFHKLERKRKFCDIIAEYVCENDVVVMSRESGC